MPSRNGYILNDFTEPQRDKSHVFASTINLDAFAKVFPCTIVSVELMLTSRILSPAVLLATIQEWLVVSFLSYVFYP
jgi:hypothetical protein